MPGIRYVRLSICTRYIPAESRHWQNQGPESHRSYLATYRCLQCIYLYITAALNACVLCASGPGGHCLSHPGSGSHLANKLLPQNAHFSPHSVAEHQP